jgi:hypothetical protein
MVLSTSKTLLVAGLFSALGSGATLRGGYADADIGVRTADIVDDGGAK